jgi:hypothetical protein
MGMKPSQIRYSDYLASPPRIVEFTADQLVDHAG